MALSSIVEFIRGGGLDLARVRESDDLEERRRRLERASQNAVPPMIAAREPAHITSAAGLLAHLLFGLED